MSKRVTVTYNPRDYAGRFSPSVELQQFHNANQSTVLEFELKQARELLEKLTELFSSLDAAAVSA